MLNWPRIRCALTRHGRIGRLEELGLRVLVCERCGQILAAGNDKLEFIDKVCFPNICQSERGLEGVWQEWGQM